MIQFICVNYHLPHMNVVSSVNITGTYLKETGYDSLKDSIHFVGKRPSS